MTPDIAGWWCVYSGAERLDLSEEARPVAVFRHLCHALEFAKRYGGYADCRPVGEDEKD